MVNLPFLFYLDEACGEEYGKLLKLRHWTIGYVLYDRVGARKSNGRLRGEGEFKLRQALVWLFCVPCSDTGQLSSVKGVFLSFSFVLLSLSFSFTCSQGPR
jgi:hypothetical protein